MVEVGGRVGVVSKLLQGLHDHERTAVADHSSGS